MRALIRNAVSMLCNVKLVALHLIMNAGLIVCASFWLLIPEAHIWQLIFAALSALMILVLLLWLHSGTFVYALAPTKDFFRMSFAVKIWRMFWLLLGAFLLLWSMNTVGGWIDSRWRTAGYLYSKAPAWLRPTAGGDSYTTLLEYFLLILYWYVIPSVILAITAARICGANFLRGLEILKHWQYWLGMAVTTMLGVCLTKLILGWIPGATLTQQTVSMVIRFSIIYLMATAAWLLTTGVLGYFVRLSLPGEIVPFSSKMVGQTAS